MKIIAESHLDHGLSPAVVAHIANRFADRDSFFIETFELPAELGEVEFGLHGPLVGDAPVPDAECRFEVRGNRAGASRVCDRPTRLTRTVTVIAGPHTGETCVLFTAFGGPLAPKEPFDAYDEERAASEAFWAEHALSA